MPQDENKEIVRRLVETINRGALGELGSLMHEDFRDHLAGPSHQGLEGFKFFLGGICSAFPDLRINLDALFAEGDTVTARLTVTGTHLGPLLGKIPATGKPATWTGIDILKIRDGKIGERWSERNIFSMFQQLGLIPKP